MAREPSQSIFSDYQRDSTFSYKKAKQIRNTELSLENISLENISVCLIKKKGQTSLQLYLKLPDDHDYDFLLLGISKVTITRLCICTHACAHTHVCTHNLFTMLKHFLSGQQRAQIFGSSFSLDFRTSFRNKLQNRQGLKNHLVPN